MKLTIFAATGGIGQQILGQAVAAGHDVTAVVRNPGKLPGQVRAVQADLATANAEAGEHRVRPGNRGPSPGRCRRREYGASWW